MGSLVPLPGVRDPGRVGSLQHGQVYRVIRAVVRGRRRGLGQAGVVRGHKPFHVPAQVVPQVPATGDPRKPAPQKSLKSLPGSWVTGSRFANGPASLYATTG